jgi:hypothetical protein
MSSRPSFERLVLFAPRIRPNQAFQPTSTPPGSWSIGRSVRGVAAAELGC